MAPFSLAKCLYGLYSIGKKLVGVSMMMLGKALLGNGSSELYSSNSIVSNALENSDIMTEEVKKNVSQYAATGTDYYESSVALYGHNNMYDFDLSYSAGKVSYEMTISEQEILVGFGPFQKNTAVYAVNVVVWDIYNFDEYRDGNSLGSILNNFGYDLQKKGYLTPFSWRAQYTVYINQ